MNDQLLTAIGAIYETAFSTARWSGALDRVADVSGGNGAMLLVRDGSLSELQISAMSSRYASPDADEYMTSLVGGEELRWVDALEQAPARTILNDLEVWPDRHVYDAIPTVRWLRELKLYHRCAARLCAHDGWRDSVAVLYRDGRDGIQPDEAKHLSTLLPHLARAVEVQRPFALLERRYHAVLSVLDRLGIGVAVLRSDGAVVIANTEAERILAANDGLRRDPHGRVCTDSQQQARWTRALEVVARNADLDAGDAGIAIPVKRRSAAEAYVIDLVPFRDEQTLGEPIAGVLALIVDPDHRAMISTVGMTRCYGLTPAEAAVCQLIAEGLTAREIADDRAVSIGTVKSQTRAIFDKTRTRNRSELIRRALSIVPPLLDASGLRTN